MNDGLGSRNIALGIAPIRIVTLHLSRLISRSTDNRPDLVNRIGFASSLASLFRFSQTANNRNLRVSTEISGNIRFEWEVVEDARLEERARYYYLVIHSAHS